MPDVIKIGKTNNYEERMRNLEKNGYCQVNGLKRFFAIKVFNYDVKEKLLQEIFADKRLGNTELFCIDPELVMSLLTEFGGKIIHLETKEQDNEKEIALLSKISEQSRLFTFEKKGLKKGDIITFTKDKNIVAKVVGNREVEYMGKNWKLSALTLQLFKERGEVNKSGAYQGAAYFEYNGKKLKDLPDIC